MDWRFNTLWFEQVEKGKIYVQNYKEQTTYENENDIKKAEYAFLSHFNHDKNPILDLLPTDNILYLDLTWVNIKDFQCLEKFKSIKRLETHYCLKLETDEGLSQLKDRLEFLHVNQSKKFKFTDELLALKKLKVLCLNSCGQLDNLHFLKNFPELIDFRFVDTNVLDGDLTPILTHPKIRTAGFLNKRHYNYNDDELESELKTKFSDDYRTTVFKGDFSTFRYDYD